MFTPEQYRAKAAEYAKLMKTAKSPDEVREFQSLERTYTVLADNGQWLVDNRDKLVPALEHGHAGETPLVAEDEHILQCLGAAVIMQWNTLPTKLQRELFDNAGSMGDLLDSAALRAQIARFLHRHKNDDDESRPASVVGKDCASRASATVRQDDEGGAAKSS